MNDKVKNLLEWVARELAMQDVRSRVGYADKDEFEVWENVKAEALDGEYLEDAKRILSYQDLALIDRRMEIVSCNINSDEEIDAEDIGEPYMVIPLAPEIKEMEDV